MMLCPTHKREMKVFGDRPFCVACLGRESVPAIDMLRQAHERIEEAAARARLLDIGIPREFTNVGFRDFVAENAWAEKVASRLQAYCSAFDKQRYVRTGFLFTGHPGTGKTHIACAMAAAIVAAGPFTARYVSLPTFTRRVRATYGARSGETAGLIQDLVDADFLVIDEIDLHGTSDNDYLMLYDIINSRHERPGCPTLAISNRELDRLTRDLDERLTSRLLEWSDPIKFEWPSRRKIRLSERRISAANRASAGTGGAR